MSIGFTCVLPGDSLLDKFAQGMEEGMPVSKDKKNPETCLLAYHKKS
jgi:hypothetical protein